MRRLRVTRWDFREDRLVWREKVKRIIPVCWTGWSEEKEEEEQKTTEQRKTERRRRGRFGLIVMVLNAGQGGERETRVWRVDETVWRCGREWERSSKQQASKQISKQAGACHLAQRKTRSQPRHVRLGGLYSSASKPQPIALRRPFFGTHKTNKSVSFREKKQRQSCVSFLDERNGKDKNQLNTSYRAKKNGGGFCHTKIVGRKYYEYRYRHKRMQGVSIYILNR